MVSTLANLGGRHTQFRGPPWERYGESGIWFREIPGHPWPAPVGYARANDRI
jgi:hypothetical protein